MRPEALTECYYYILLCLYHNPDHVNSIIHKTEALSNGTVKIGSGSMYEAISYMMKREWIFEIQTMRPEDCNKRFYQITTPGRDVLEQEYNRLRELVKNAAAIINGEIN